MPTKFGIGFVAEKPLPEELVPGYRYEQAGHFHNYHVTEDNWRWPSLVQPGVVEYKIDGFSPNLNKLLHVGHIRQLAIANALRHILAEFNPKFVAILGASQGVKAQALTDLDGWFEFTGYRPKIYYDLLLPTDIPIETRDPTPEEIEKKIIDVNRKDDLGGDFDLPKVMDFSNGPQIMIRSDGRPLYAYYDVVFAKWVAPTHYITATEQKPHFANLDLGHKHLAMGLVLGADGTKIKSRTGDYMLATEALSQIEERLAAHNGGESLRWSKEIAWNILCWNFLHAARETNLKFEAEKWVQPDSPGMYVTYTYARVLKALGTYPRDIRDNWSGPLSDDDVKLLGLAEQYVFYHQQAIAKMDPAPIANFSHELARAMGAAYERERIRGGRDAFYHVMRHAALRLNQCITSLGMFPIEEV
jgi:arginyl-tRNA synthetase